MKIFRRLLLSVASVIITGAFGFLQGQVVQQGCCPNAGFDSSNFSGWKGYTGSAPFPTWTQGFNSQNNSPVNSAFQHSIMTVQGLDPNCWVNTPQCDTSSCVTFLAPGGGVASCRLGNMQVGYGAERLTYRLLVDTCNSSFTYSFAVVFQDPGHSPTDQPAFNVYVSDTNGVILDSACGLYSVYATANDPNFISNPTNCSCDAQVRYRCWSSIGIDLTNYIGQYIELTFWTKDCGQGGHYGYAYIDATCSFLTADAAYCPNGNGSIVLVAPTGYSTYQWYTPQGNPIPGPQGTNDTCVYTGPAQVGDTFTVAMGSFQNANCQTLLLVALVPLSISATTAVTNAPCYGALGSVISSPTSGYPGWTYSWTNLGNGNVVQVDHMNTIQNDTLAIGAGTYYMLVTDTLGCRFEDTLTITQPPQPVDTLNLVQYFCTGDSAANLMYVPTADQQPMPWNNNNYEWQTYPGGVPLTGPNYTPWGPNNVNLTIHNFPTDGSQFYFAWLLNGCQRKSVVTLKHQTYSPYFNPDSSANVFSPNGDGRNDVFYPFSTPHLYAMLSDPHHGDMMVINPNGDTVYVSYNPHNANEPNQIEYYAKDYHIKIFNRWGQLVFETSDYSQPWDGKNKGGNMCSDGVYYWISTFKNRCAPDTDPPVEYKGYVHLMK